MPTELKFTYRKGVGYRMIHADGAVGGVGPNGRYIHLTIYSERRTIPRELVFDVTPDGELAKEPRLRDDIGGVFRELESCVVMDIPTAKAIKTWLEKQLEKHEEVVRELEVREEKKSGGERDQTHG